MTTATHHSDTRFAHTTSAWDQLFAELDAWTATGRTATLWWRDDDAQAGSEELDRLFALQARAGIPLALAVVPNALAPSLAETLSGTTAVTVLQHGYSHDNFAGDGDRKIELDGSRPADYVIADLAMGLQTLSVMPGWWPVMVPPWNRIAAHLIPLLPELGYRGLSTLGSRKRRAPVSRLTQNNVHLDPIDWRGRFGPAGGFIGDNIALDLMIGHLRDRRTGRADRDEATGLMTHHRVQGDVVWNFSAQLIEATAAHPAAQWCAAADLFPA